MVTATTGYSASPETNLVQVSYGIETTWGTAPASAFKAVRITGESLAGQKQRTRPAEMNVTGAVSAALTTQESASGQVNFGLSYGTYDDWLACVLGSDWVTGAGTDTLKDSTTFRTLFIQKKLTTGEYLTYAGSALTDCSLSASLGQPLTGSFTVAAKQEVSATTDASTGSIVAAPTGKIFDNVGGFVSCTLDGADIGTKVHGWTLKMTRSGATAEYALGGSGAAGMIFGLLEVTGTLDVYFKDMTLYQRYVNETSGSLALTIQDAAANKYVFTIPACTMMNPKIVAGGPNQALMAQFSLEGNPSAGGNTIEIDRTPHT